MPGVKHRARMAVRRLGFDLVPATHESGARRARIIAFNHIDTILDVGGNEGYWGAAVRDSGYRGRLISFEPQSKAFAALASRAARDSLWDCRHVALGAAAGEVTLNLSGYSPATSVLAMEDDHVRLEPSTAYVGSETVPLERLDELLEREQLLETDARVYLKIDVQGFELEVLRGSTGLLDRVAAVELEMLLATLYAGQAPFDELIAFLYEHGFVLVGTELGYVDPVSGYAAWIDGMFVRGPLPHLAGA